MSGGLVQIGTKPRAQEDALVRRPPPLPAGAPKAALVSLGCAKNTVDSEIMLAALARAEPGVDC